MILGLDVSTSIVGATVLDNDGELVYCEAWDLRNKNHFPTLYEKGKQIQKMIHWLYQVERFDITEVFIEQSLLSFRPGFSSAKTLLTLSKFNGIVSYICQEEYLKPPQYISAPTARKSCGIKVEKGKKAKEIVLNFVLDKEDKFNIEYTRHGNPKPGSYDRADAYIIAKAGWKSLKF
jgi:hypothetical protein